MTVDQDTERRLGITLDLVEHGLFQGSAIEFGQQLRHIDSLFQVFELEYPIARVLEDIMEELQGHDLIFTYQRFNKTLAFLGRGRDAFTARHFPIKVELKSADKAAL